MTQADAAQDFPDLNDYGKSEEQKKSGTTFINKLYPNDSLTVSDGFINEVRSHVKGDRTLYFVRVGLFQGSIQDGDDYKGDITNCDVLAGSTIEKWISTMDGVADPLKGIRLRMEFRNLKYTPKLHEGKAYLDSRGILETVQIGKLLKS